MNATLSIEDINTIVRELEAGLPHDACRTCECLQAFLPSFSWTHPQSRNH